MTPTSWVCWENVHNEERLQHPWLIGPSSDVPGRIAHPMKWFGQATDVLIKVFHSLPWALCPKLLNKHCWILNTAYFVCTCIHCILTPCLLEEITRMHGIKQDRALLFLSLSWMPESGSPELWLWCSTLLWLLKTRPNKHCIPQIQI